jgi:hypothetical protein
VFPSVSSWSGLIPFRRRASKTQLDLPRAAQGGWTVFRGLTPTTCDIRHKALCICDDQASQMWQTRHAASSKITGVVRGQAPNLRKCGE